MPPPLGALPGLQWRAGQGHCCSRPGDAARPSRKNTQSQRVRSPVCFSSSCALSLGEDLCPGLNQVSFLSGEAGARMQFTPVILRFEELMTLYILTSRAFWQFASRIGCMSSIYKDIKTLIATIDFPSCTRHYAEHFKCVTFLKNLFAIILWFKYYFLKRALWYGSWVSCPGSGS